MERAVKRGLQRRQEQSIVYVGIDEKSFGSGQDYVSLMVDIDRSRVLEVAKDRTTEACNKLWSSLSEAKKKRGFGGCHRLLAGLQQQHARAGSASRDCS